jgi:hypothetical protein
MGIRNAMAHIVTGVAALTPGSDAGEGYYCDADAAGNVTPLEKVAGRQSRQFDIQNSADTGPQDDGESGLTQRRFSIQLDLRMSYPIGGDEALVRRMALEDMGIVGRALASISIGAAATTAGILSVMPVSTSTLTQLSNDEGREVAWMWFVTFTLIYREV